MHNKWSVDRTPHQYNLLGSEKSYQFRFELRSGFNEHNRKGITVDEDKFDLVSHLDPERETPLECAQELLQFFEDNYLVATTKSELKKLIAFLQKTEKQDEIEWYKEAIVKLKEKQQKLTEEVAKKEKTLKYLIDEAKEEEKWIA